MSERFGLPEFGLEERGLSPEQILLNEARAAALEILYAPEDEFSREIARKIASKIQIKERAASLIDHADDVTVYQEFKKLGIFVVRDTEATFDYQDRASGLSLHKGDKYLDLHLPPVPPHLRTRGAVNASLDLVQRYVTEQGLRPKYLMGVTYERMARLAKRRFGFSIAYPSPDSLPESIVRGVGRVYNGFTERGMEGYDMGIPAIVFRELTPLYQPELTNPRASALGGLALRNSGQE